MTTTLPVPTGPTNKQIIDRAYQALGVSDTMFGRTPEEYGSAFALLRPMMAEWPFDQLGFISEDEAGSRVDEESGIAFKWLNAVALTLAEHIAAEIGKTMAPEARKQKNRAYSALCSAVAVIPRAEYADGTITGQGWKRGRSYFPAAR